MSYKFEPKQTMYAESSEYLKVFGFNIIDTVSNRKVGSCLLHEALAMLFCYPVSKREQAYVRRIVKNPAIFCKQGKQS